MKTVKNCNVLILKMDADGNYVVSSPIFKDKETATSELAKMVRDGNLPQGEYYIAPLYWKLNVEIPEVAPKIKIS
jgi:hypothetical protein